MPVQIWHKPIQRGKRPGAEISGIGGRQLFDPGRRRGAVFQFEFTYCCLQKRDLATVGIDQTHRKFRMKNRNNQPGQTAAAADIKPAPLGRRAQSRKLRAIGNVALFKLIQGTCGDEIYRWIPLADQRCVMRQSCFT